MACSNTTEGTIAGLVKRFDRTGFNGNSLDPGTIENGASGIAASIEDDPLAIRAPDIAVCQDPPFVTSGDLPCFGGDHAADIPGAECLPLPFVTRERR
jgi:hypothetical protein